MIDLSVDCINVSNALLRKIWPNIRAILLTKCDNVLYLHYHFDREVGDDDKMFLESVRDGIMLYGIYSDVVQEFSFFLGHYNNDGFYGKLATECILRAYGSEASIGEFSHGVYARKEEW